MKHRLLGEVSIRGEFAKEKTIRYTEIIEAPADASREELIEESLEGFKEEEEPVWGQGYPLILPEPEQSGAGIAGEAELRDIVLCEALPYIKVKQENRFAGESIQYVTAIVATDLTGKGVRATTREVAQFLEEAGYP